MNTTTVSKPSFFRLVSIFAFFLVIQLGLVQHANAQGEIAQNATLEVGKNTVYLEFLVAQQGKQQELVDLVQPSLETFSQQEGFVSSILHRSTDSEYVVSLTQFEDAETLQAALDNKTYQEQATAYEVLSESRNVGKYQIASLDSPDSLTALEVKTEHDYVVVIDRIAVAPEQYEPTLAQTIGHAKGFVMMEGFRVATVFSLLENEEKNQISTYANWVSVEAFLGTISKMTGQTLTTMEDLNTTLATLGAKTEYQAYEVVSVMTKGAQ
jgi:quinol monooxygenase YgiN